MNYNILTLNYEYPPLGGGAAPVTKNLAEEFAKSGHNTDIVTMGFKNLPETEEKNGVTIHRVRCLRSSQSMSNFYEMLSYLPTAFYRARKLIETNDYDIIHCHFILPTGLLALALNKKHDIPYIITSHGSDVPEYNPDRFNLLHSILAPVWTEVINNASTVVSPSDYLAKLISNQKKNAPIKVIPNGINADRFNVQKEKKEQILVTSRLFERKGIQYFLEAIENVDTDWDIIITGEGPYKKELEKKANNMRIDVTFTGWVERERLENLLETSEVFVFPSSHENCPVSLQEGMAAGCAIIASKYSGTGEVIGNAGIQINPKNKTEFSGAINELIRDSERRSELQKAAKERIQKKYQWNVIMNKYLNEIKKQC